MLPLDPPDWYWEGYEFKPSHWPLQEPPTDEDEEEQDEPPVLVVDAGRLRWRIGIAGDDAPSYETDGLTPHINLPLPFAKKNYHTISNST